MDPKLLEDLDRVRPPKQRRSLKVFEAALAAFDELLRHRPLAEVAMQDVADRAGASVTSVYARFDGKAALVLALHELAIARGLAEAAQAVEADRRASMTLEEAVRMIVSTAVGFAEANGHIFRAVLAASDEETFQRVGAFSQEMSAHLSTLLVPKLSGDPVSADRDVDFAWRSVLAVLQQAWMLGGAEPSRFPITREEKVERLVRQFLAHLPRPSASP